MITVEQKELIRRAYHLEGKSIRQIHRETGLHRETIRKALGEGLVSGYTRQSPPSEPVLGPVKAVIHQWLSEDAQRPRKQRHTSKRIWERLRDEYGFVGAESTVRRYVGQQRRHLRQDVFVPLSYSPGSVAQVDFGEASFLLRQKEVVAQLFCLRMGYSKQAFVMALPRQTQECFFEGHVQAFAFLGGVPRQLVYDNLKTAVQQVLEGGNREEQASFVAFRSHHLFESRFCRVAAAHEKGLVEGLVGYARRNWFVPLPQVESWHQLNQYLWQQCVQEGARKLRGMQQTIGEALETEKQSLLPLPERPFPCCRYLPVQTNGFAMVTFETNRYSVPTQNAHENLWLRAFWDRVEITNTRSTLAVHARSYAREEDVLNPLHYLDLLEQRPGAFEQAAPLESWRQEWPTVYEDYLSALRQHHPYAKATREFIQVLKLHASHPSSVIATVLERALACHCYEADGVTLLLRRTLEERAGREERAGQEEQAVETEASSPSEFGSACGVVDGVDTPVAWPDVRQFDTFLSPSGAAQASASKGE